MRGAHDTFSSNPSKRADSKVEPLFVGELFHDVLFNCRPCGVGRSHADQARRHRPHPEQRRPRRPATPCPRHPPSGSSSTSGARRGAARYVRRAAVAAVPRSRSRRGAAPSRPAKACGTRSGAVGCTARRTRSARCLRIRVRRRSVRWQDRQRGSDPPPSACEAGSSWSTSSPARDHVMTMPARGRRPRRRGGRSAGRRRLVLPGRRSDSRGAYELRSPDTRRSADHRTPARMSSRHDLGRLALDDQLSPPRSVPALRSRSRRRGAVEPVRLPTRPTTTVSTCSLTRR